MKDILKARIQCSCHLEDLWMEIKEVEEIMGKKDKKKMSLDKNNLIKVDIQDTILWEINHQIVQWEVMLRFRMDLGHRWTHQNKTIILKTFNWNKIANSSNQTKDLSFISHNSHLIDGNSKENKIFNKNSIILNSQVRL